MIEVVESKVLFEAVDREYPDTPAILLEQRIGKSDGYLRKKRGQRYIRFETADELLTALDLSHLFSWGEIPVIKIYSFTNPSGVPRGASKEILGLRESLRKSRLRTQAWRRRALEAERKLGLLTTESS